MKYDTTYQTGQYEIVKQKTFLICNFEIFFGRNKSENISSGFRRGH